MTNQVLILEGEGQEELETARFIGWIKRRYNGAEQTRLLNTLKKYEQTWAKSTGCSFFFKGV